MPKIGTEPSPDTRKEDLRHEGKTGKLLIWDAFRACNHWTHITDAGANSFGLIVDVLIQGDTTQSRSLDTQSEGLVGFPSALLHRKDPSAVQRQLNYHLAPPNPSFPPHPGSGRAFPPLYPVSRLPFRVSQPQHPGMAPQSQQQQQQQQLSPVYTGASQNASFFSGPIPPHRGVQSPTLDGTETAGVEELNNSIRTPMGQAGGLAQHSRVSSFVEDGQDGNLGDNLGQ